MIYITGDVHGDIDFPKLEKYFQNRYVSKKDFLIILGDVGVIWNNDDKNLNKLRFLGPTVIAIDGNHENYDLLNKFPIVNYLNARMRKITQNIYFVLRGEIFELNKLKFLCIGGACSIDKKYRKEHVSWWKEEVITNRDIDNAVDNLRKHNFKVDYVLTHCIDSATCKNVLRYSTDESTDQLSKIKNIVKYKQWYCGHYHIDEYLNKKIRCFYNDVLEIDARYKGTKNVLSNYYSYVDGVMRSITGRKVKITPDDLPEWYLENYCYYSHYYNLLNVKDVAFSRSPFSNHINKDCSIYLSYDKEIKKNIQYEPINKDECELSTWRVYLNEFILGLEKYSPTLNLDKLKAQVNIAYDFYANDSRNYFASSYPDPRPYPDVVTPILKSINYSVYLNDIILLNFETYDLAVQYATFFAKSRFKEYEIEDVGKYKIINKLNKDEFLIIKEVEGERVEYGFRPYD